MRSKILAGLSALALVACSQEAKQEAAPAQETVASGYAITLVSQDQLRLPPGSPITITPVDGGLRLQGFVRNPSSQLETDGASVALGMENEAAFSGHRVRVTFRARGVDGATQFTSAYSTNGSGNSGWRNVAVTDSLQDVGYVFDVPAVIRPGNDFLGIAPPETGAIELQSIRVEIADALRE